MASEEDDMGGPLKKGVNESKQEWRTPKPLFNALHSIFHFTKDAAADDKNHLLPKPHYWNDAFSEDWTGQRLFINPPFKQSILERFMKWVWKAEMALILFQLKSAGTEYFHE
jgi:DNA N-6-adenine-methyltransferase (Dam)